MASASGTKSSSTTIIVDDGELPELSAALPKKYGIPPSPVQLLCVAGSNDLLILGTNHSLMVIHHLRTLVTDKVSLEGSLKRSGVTALCLFPGVYNRLAIGRQHGLINIYQLAEAEEHKRRSMIKKVHSASITCLAWDTRGTLLFSSDESGKVYATEVDMKDGKHHSWLVYECPSPIIQLSYSSMMLLVSSTASSVVCHIARDISQTNPPKVGSKDRKVGEYGGCFATVVNDGEPGLVLFVTRPGLRIWRADHKGTVQATLKFKDLIEQGNIPAIKLLGRRREASASGAASEAQQLGRLRSACSKYLLAWHGDSVWLLDPGNGQMAGFTSGIGPILDVCIYKRWVYILREPPYARQSPVIRLGFDPSVVPLGSSPALPRFRNVADTPKGIHLPSSASENQLSVAWSKVESATSEDASPITARKSEAEKNDASAEDPVAPSSTPAQDSPSSEVTSDKFHLTTEQTSMSTTSDTTHSVDTSVEQVSDEAAHTGSNNSTAADEPCVLASQSSESTDGPSTAASGTSLPEPASNVSAASTPSPCPSPVMPSKSSEAVSVSLATSSAAVLSSVTSTAAAAVSSSNNSVASTGEKVHQTTTPEQSPTRGEDVALGSSSSPRLARSRTPPSASTQVSSNSRATSPSSRPPLMSGAPANSSKPPLLHAADSKVPIIPPRFDISMDDADTTVLIKPKNKRKVKKPKKVDSASSIGLSSSSKPSSEPASPEPVRSHASPTPDAPPEEVSLAAAATTAASATATTELLPSNDMDSADEERRHESVDGTEVAAGQAKAAEQFAKTVPETLSADCVHSEISSRATAAQTDQSNIADVSPANAEPSTEHATTAACASTGADCPSERTASEVSEVTGAGLAEMHQPVSVSVHVSSVDDTSMASAPKAASDSFMPFQMNKKAPTALLSTAELDSDDELAQADHPLASSPRVASSHADASGDSSGANSAVNSGEHNLTSIYDIGHADAEEEDEAAHAAEPTSNTSPDTAAATAANVYLPDKNKGAAWGQGAAAAAAAKASSSDKAAAASSKQTSMGAEDMSLADSWVQCPSPCRYPLSEIVCTPTHIWAIDSKDYVYTWSLSKRRWINLKGSARHISASPSGDVIWACSKSGSLYHRAGIERRVRIGTEWRKMDMKVKSIALDYKRSWVLTASGSVKLRRDVDLACPTGQRWDDMVDAPNNLRYLAAGNGVLWAITTHNVVLARLGISRHKPLGTSWEMVCPGQNFMHVAIGINDVAWLVNMDGVVCFMKKVSQTSPLGDSDLWLSALGQFVVHDASLLEALWTWSLVKRSEPLRYVASAQNCVAVLNTGSNLLFSGGSMVGTAYRTMSASGIAASMRWISVSASALHSDDGRVWMLQRNGEVFSVQHGERLAVVESPTRRQLTQISSSLGSVWAVVANGQILERTGVSDYCPTGTAWKLISTEALKGTKIRQVSCGLHSGWAVDDKGQAWLRLGELSQMSLGAAANPWLPIDPPTAQTKFTQVVVGPGGWHVWAVDSAGGTYSRLDVGIDNPAGSCWQAIGGVNSSRLAISNVKVWACCANGDVVWRSNVTPRNPTGDYWKRIPGTFSDIAVTPDDVLWLIDSEGYLFKRETSVYNGSSTQSKLTHGASLDSWVLI
ncbi:tectonin beta-propeller repeat-containing protein 2-like [Sycon ciliatum]|uniref:tectonin beta-propeller repeat-containing protein 2-like n=1 Tax=Sycon ciliatum TaxID=27933 RepID=UPI0020ABCD30|eukprot:scpid12296/ scgid23509/ Tectonin beta-propeller repeat-containing protein 2; WD repeat-containing protein KIAA0329/KIAA0297